MFISSPVNNSRRLEYLSELIKHIHIDSYGCWKKNCSIEGDVGYRTKLEIIKKYKFTIAFENAISKDYVTEKFFDPLITGSVPVYLGAPNIEQFSPGDNSFIDIRNYSSPKDLALHIQSYCLDRDRYNEFLEWKRRPLRPEFENLIKDQEQHPFVRLIYLIKRKSESL